MFFVVLEIMTFFWSLHFLPSTITVHYTPLELTTHHQLLKFGDMSKSYGLLPLAKSSVNLGPGFKKSYKIQCFYDSACSLYANKTDNKDHQTEQ